MIMANRKFMLHRTITALALALITLGMTGVAACSEGASAAAASSGLPDRDPPLARQLVEQEHAILLDVRTPGEFAEGALPGAINIPVQELKARLAEVEELTGADELHAIVVYCRSGRRSGIAKEVLLEAGYDRVTDLGPIGNWR